MSSNVVDFPAPGAPRRDIIKARQAHGEALMRDRVALIEQRLRGRGGLHFRPADRIRAGQNLGRLLQQARENNGVSASSVRAEFSKLYDYVISPETSDLGTSKRPRIVSRYLMIADILARLCDWPAWRIKAEVLDGTSLWRGETPEDIQDEQAAALETMIRAAADRVVGATKLRRFFKEAKRIPAHWSEDDACFVPDSSSSILSVDYQFYPETNRNVPPFPSVLIYERFLKKVTSKINIDDHIVEGNSSIFLQVRLDIVPGEFDYDNASILFATRLVFYPDSKLQKYFKYRDTRVEDILENVVSEELNDIDDIDVDYDEYNQICWFELSPSTIISFLDKASLDVDVRIWRGESENHDDPVNKVLGAGDLWYPSDRIASEVEVALRTGAIEAEWLRQAEMIIAAFEQYKPEWLIAAEAATRRFSSTPE